MINRIDGVNKVDEVEKASKVDEANKADKDSMVMTAFQTACVAIIVLNAKLVGDLLYSIISEASSLQQLPLFVLLGLISLLNFLEITNNWASIKTYFYLYNGSLFVIDVLTLGAFFWQIYVLSRLGDKPELTEENVIWVAIFSYVFIFILYIVWNCFILCENNKKDNEAEKLGKGEEKSIKRASFERGFQVCVLLAFRIISLVVRDDGMNIFWLVVLGCLVSYGIKYTFAHNRRLNIFDTIIKTKGGG